MVLHLAEQLDVPLRERNTLLIAAGYAPVYPETPLQGEDMASFDAIEYFVTERMVLFISKKHQKRGRWFGRRMLFDSPTRPGLVRLAGTVLAPRPKRWR